MLVSFSSLRRVKKFVFFLDESSSRSYSKNMNNTQFTSRCRVTQGILTSVESNSLVRSVWALRVLARLADLGDRDACTFQAG